MNVISLSPFDLSIAAFLTAMLAILSVPMKLGIARRILVAEMRTIVQLVLVGLVLKSIFNDARIGWVGLIALVMLIVAAREVTSRQKKRFIGLWGFGIGALSISISSFSITFFALTVIINIKPWYEPQYAVPLLGMMLGNTMTGMAIGLDRLTQTASDQRTVVEARLMLGEEWTKAIENIKRESIRSGLIPIMNSMAVAGIVSLPGMMTGQILAGSPPMKAVKYQILIIFLIASGTGFGTMTAVWLGSRRLFDKRHRLRLDRLQNR